MIEFAPLSYQIACLCSLKDKGLITEEEYERISEFLYGKYGR